MIMFVTNVNWSPIARRMDAQERHAQGQGQDLQNEYSEGRERPLTAMICYHHVSENITIVLTASEL